MIKNYLKIAWRNILKNKTYSIINILGLAVGTLSCLFIMLFVLDQYSYDKHHQGSEDVYRLSTNIKMPGDDTFRPLATSSPPIAPGMKAEFPEVIQFTRVIATENMGAKQHLLRFGEVSFYENNAVFVDSTFFDIFTYHFVKGNPSKALTDPYSVVLLESVADKLFGSQDPLGATISIDNAYGKHDFKVTGVIDKSLGKTHLEANFIMSMNSGGIGGHTLNNTFWAVNNYANSYIKLRPGTDATVLSTKIPAFLTKHGAQQFKDTGIEKKLTLQPISAIHTTGGYENEMSKTVSASFLWMLVLVAILIQFIACINFMNLATASASKRAKEIGVRKVVGAGKKQLLIQFLGESMLIAGLAMLFAIAALFLLLPFLNQLTQAEIQFTALQDYRIWIMLVGLAILTGIFAGSYPAFYLTAFNSIQVLKGKVHNQISAVGIRRSLVVFQFILSIVMISSVIVIYSQLAYMKKKDLGFDQEQKIIFSFHSDDVKRSIPAFADELRQMPEIKSVSRANNYLSQFIGNNWTYFLAGGNSSTGHSVNFINTDEYFANANGLRLISGRDFRQHDQDRILINETLAKKLNLTPESAVGTLIYPQQDKGGTDRPLEILGVVQDFNYNSLHSEISPIALRYDETGGNGGFLIVNTATDDYQSLLKKLANLWDKHITEVPFEYRFLDAEVQKQYETEVTLAQIINSFTLVAIFISCLGLFGLAAFNAEQRSKEIGIRKVLGASVFGLIKLLSGDFVKLVLLALVIAIPITWWAMRNWLDAFAYHVTIAWWMFAVSGLAALMIAMFSVGWQAIRAALANPVDSLREE